MNVPWTEKYRPKKINDIIGQKNIKIFRKFIEKKFIPNMILFGESGVGKTSIIRVIINEIYSDPLMYLFINASEERGIDIIRDNVYQFSLTETINNVNIPKMVVLDEIDSLTIEAQNMLGKIMDITKNISFCLICNQIKNIEITLRSKCVKFHINIPPMEEIKEKINEIIKLEKLNIDEVGINCILSKTKDLRKILNILQTMYISNEEINETTINKYLSFPEEKEIDIILDKLLQDSFIDNYVYLTDLILDGRHIFDILNRIIEKLMNYSTDEIFLKQIFKKLGKMEAKINLCSQNMVCSYIVSIFILFRKLYKKKNISYVRS